MKITIKGAYKIILDYLLKNGYIKSEEVSSLFDVNKLLERLIAYPYTIYIEISITLNFNKRNPIKQVIFLMENHKNDFKFYIDPNFSDLPSLSIKQYLVIGIIHDIVYEEDYGGYECWNFSEPILHFLDQPTILYLFNLAKSKKLKDKHFKILSDHNSSKFIYREKEGVFVRFEFPPLLLRNSSHNTIEYTTIPEEYYNEFTCHKNSTKSYINAVNFPIIFSKIEKDLSWQKFSFDSFSNELEKANMECHTSSFY